MNKEKSIKAGVARPERDSHLYEYWKTHKTTKAAAGRMFHISKQQATVIINRMIKKREENTPAALINKLELEYADSIKKYTDLINGKG